MYAYFIDGKIDETEAIGNVRTIYYPIDDKDSTLMGLVYMETDTMRMFMDENHKMEKIWSSKTTGTWYPMTQIPPTRYKLEGFTWFDYIRPLDKDDIFEWRPKKAGTQLKKIERHKAPLQHIDGGEMTTSSGTPPDSNGPKEQKENKE